MSKQKPPTHNRNGIRLLPTGVRGRRDREIHKIDNLVDQIFSGTAVSKTEVTASHTVEDLRRKYARLSK